MNPPSDPPTIQPPPGVEQIFYEALEKAPEARGAYLDHACAGDAALRREVENLLADHDRARSFLNEEALPNSPPRAPTTEAVTEKPGTHIGPYKLLEQIGEGGFGTVWVAEQERPVRRRVALKVIKLGMDTREVLARFDQERQALALMDHPNIARMFDAGATPLGRPYFVMELVRGVKITEYCDSARLPTAQRLQLFMQVCHAVQHAHQKGVIHRDLKPSNILITLHDGVPVPKVIDFGVAKATREQRLTDLTVYTQFQQMIGTPAYMAPEQAEMSGLDVDTRSDIYSLGVLLYELLTGKTPFDHERLLHAGCDEMRRVLREEDPPKPSAFVSTMAVDLRTDVARRHGEEGARLVHLIRGDLDWIAMKALEKDRSRRYDTASSLAEDIGRHLSNEPVQARPHSAGYRFRRFAWRNRVVLTSGAAIAVALLAGTAMSLWQAAKARREAERAQLESDRATAALGELRGSAPAFAAMARGLASQEKFDEAIASYSTAIELRPDMASYVLAKADLLQSQFRFAEAAAAYREAARLDPGNKKAASNAGISVTLAAELAAKQNLSRESLAGLLSVMAKEQRPAAEMLRVGRLLGEENKLLLSYWSERLKELAISPDRPIEERLKSNPTGELELDLSHTEITDLTPLKGMPLGTLKLSGCYKVSNTGPLRGMPLKTLVLDGTEVVDLEPIGTMKSLAILRLRQTKVQDISSLRGLSLRELDLSQSRVADLSPLRGMPLEVLEVPKTPVSDLSPLQGLPLQVLNLFGTKVVDIAPLAGMPLKDLDCSLIPAKDFSPLALAGANLERLQLFNTFIRSVSILKGMPLKSLNLSYCLDATDLDDLGSITSLESLVLPHLSNVPDAEFSEMRSLRNLSRLRSVAFGENNENFTVEGFWKYYDSAARSRKVGADLLLRCREGRFADAISLFRDAYREEIQTGPDKWREYAPYGMLLLANGDIAGYQSVCRELAAHQHRRGEGDLAAAELCLMGPDPGVPIAEVRRLMPHLALIRDDTPYRGLFVFGAGLLEYRTGQFAEATELLDKLEAERFQSLQAYAAAVLSMTHHQQGNFAAANSHLARCKTLLDGDWIATHSQHTWRFWLKAYLLWKEAESLVGGYLKTPVEK